MMMVNDSNYSWISDANKMEKCHTGKPAGLADPAEPPAQDRLQCRLGLQFPTYNLHGLR